MLDCNIRQFDLEQGVTISVNHSHVRKSFDAYLAGEPLTGEALKAQQREARRQRILKKGAERLAMVNGDRIPPGGECTAARYKVLLRVLRSEQSVLLCASWQLSPALHWINTCIQEYRCGASKLMSRTYMADTLMHTQVAMGKDLSQMMN